MITAPNVANSETVTDELFRHLYILYSDYVMKDPFYSLDMPIKVVYSMESQAVVCTTVNLEQEIFSETIPNYGSLLCLWNN